MMNVIVPSSNPNAKRDFDVVFADAGIPTSLSAGEYRFTVLPIVEEGSAIITSSTILEEICSYYKFTNIWIDSNGFITAFDNDLKRVKGYVVFHDPYAPEPPLEYDELEDEVELLSAQLAATKSEIDRINAELTAAQLEIVELRNSLQSTQATLTEKLNTISAKEQEIAELEADLQVAADRLSAKQIELDAANDSIATLNQEKATLTQTNEQLVTDLGDANTTISLLSAEFQRVNGELTEAKSDLSDMEATLISLTNTNSSLNSEIASLEAEVAAERANFELAQDTIATLTSEKETLEDEAVVLQASLDQANSDLAATQAALASMTTERDNLQGQLDQLYPYLNEASQALMEAYDENRELTAEVVKLKEEAAWNASISGYDNEEITRLEGLLYHTPVVMNNNISSNTVNTPTDVVIVTADSEAGIITSSYEIYGIDIKMRDVEVAPESNITLISAGPLRMDNISLYSRTDVEGYWTLQGVGLISMINCDFDCRSSSSFLNLAMLDNGGNPNAINILNCEFDSGTDTLSMDLIQSNTVITFKDIKFYFGGTNSTFLSFRNMNNATNLHFIFENCEFADFGFNQPFLNFQGDLASFGPSNLQFTFKNCSAYADEQFLRSSADLSKYIGTDASDRQFLTIGNGVDEALPYASNMNVYPTFNFG